VTPDGPRVIRAGNCEIGGPDFVVMAGPCAVETERQIFKTAEAVARAGAHILRGGAFKPRTSPYAFQGLGVEGLKLLASAGRAFGLPIVTEVMSDGQVDTVAEYADILQIGSRSMENFALLHEVSRTNKPVLLKRGMTSTVEEMAASAAFLIENGNPNVILCERGIRTFGTATRNTCDIVAVPLLHKLTGLPVIVDPSHATGVRELIAPLACAAVAIGADGLIVEVHPDPDRAWSDGPQSLSFDQFEEMMREIDPIREIWRDKKAEVLASCIA
jgi:3-deoxy-7-phosphoheptulonate synthase